MPFPFLALPLELRALIYTQTTTAPFTPLTQSTFLGLYLSNPQIRAEYIAESDALLRRYLLSLSHRVRGVRAHFTKPSHLSAKYTLRISLAMGVYTEYPAFDARNGVGLRDVFGVGWEKIVIEFHDDGGGGFGLDNVRWVHRWVVQGLLHNANAGQVVVEVPEKVEAHVARWLEVVMDDGLSRRGMGEGVVCMKEKKGTR
jgi:hypothetical protein